MSSGYGLSGGILRNDFRSTFKPAGTILPKDSISNLSKLKGMRIRQMKDGLNDVGSPEKGRNIVGKGENASTQCF